MPYFEIANNIGPITNIKQWDVLKPLIIYETYSLSRIIICYFLRNLDKDPYVINALLKILILEYECASRNITNLIFFAETLNSSHRTMHIPYNLFLSFFF